MIHNTPPDTPSVCASYLYCHLLIPPLFGWLLCVFSSIGGLIKPMCYLFLFNFVIQIVTRIDGTMPPPTLQTSRATSQTSLLPQTPTVGWLLCLHFKFWPLQAKHHFLSIFWCVLFCGLQTSQLTVSPPNQTRGA